MKNKINVALNLLAAFNLIDGIATLSGLHFKYAQEANPLMSIIIGFSPVLFIAIKILLSIMILSFKKISLPTFPKIVIYILLFLYTLIMVDHCIILFRFWLFL